MHQVFISYRRSDSTGARVLAEHVRARLAGLGWKLYLDDDGAEATVYADSRSELEILRCAGIVSSPWSSPYDDGGNEPLAQMMRYWLDRLKDCDTVVVVMSDGWLQTRMQPKRFVSPMFQALASRSSARAMSASTPFLYVPGSQCDSYSVRSAGLSDRAIMAPLGCSEADVFADADVARAVSKRLRVLSFATVSNASRAGCLALKSAISTLCAVNKIAVGIKRSMLTSTLNAMASPDIYSLPDCVGYRGLKNGSWAHSGFVSFTRGVGGALSESFFDGFYSSGWKMRSNNFTLTKKLRDFRDHFWALGPNRYVPVAEAATVHGQASDLFGESAMLNDPRELSLGWRAGSVDVSSRSLVDLRSSATPPVARSRGGETPKAELLTEPRGKVQHLRGRREFSALSQRPPGSGDGRRRKINAQGASPHMKLYRLFCGPQAVDPGSVASLGSNMQTYLRDRGTSAGQVRTTTSASPESNIVCLYRGKVTD